MDKWEWPKCELTADRAAEYLDNRGWEWENCYSNKTGEVFILGWRRDGDIDDRKILGAATPRWAITAALNAAARAVYERGKDK